MAQLKTDFREMPETLRPLPRKMRHRSRAIHSIRSHCFGGRSHTGRADWNYSFTSLIYA